MGRDGDQGTGTASKKGCNDAAILPDAQRTVTLVGPLGFYLSFGISQFGFLIVPITISDRNYEASQVILPHPIHSPLLLTIH
jgi:hypothetical protein